MTNEKKAPGRRSKIERARRLWAQVEPMLASGLVRDVTITAHLNGDVGGADLTLSTREAQAARATPPRGRGRVATAAAAPLPPAAEAAR